MVLDWELSGMLELASELGSTALSLAKGPGFDTIEPAIFRSVLDGYVAGGGALPPAGPSWFVFMIGGWLGFTRWNIVRCVAGGEASTGPDLARCHEEGVSREEFLEIFSVGLVVGGSIVIPHLRRAMARLEELGGAE